jgi:hypothetical protein
MNSVQFLQFPQYKAFGMILSFHFAIQFIRVQYTVKRKSPYFINSPSDQLAPLKNTKSITSLLARALDLLTVELPEIKYKFESRHISH